MIREVRVETIEQIFELMTEQPYVEKIGRHRSLYIYRGLQDASYPLVTSLDRNCKSFKRQLEPQILENFAKYAELEEPSVRESVWRKMIFGQHHGLPTRLLDWTQSPLAALHFATTERDMNNMDRRDGVVWRADVKELDDLLPEAFQKVRRETGRDVFSVDMVHEACPDGLEEYDRMMGDRALLVVEPPSIDPRIVNQYSFFCVVPNGMTDVAAFLREHTERTVRYVIDRKLRWQIRDMLDQYNVSERIFTPGLDGICAWLGRHYFVQDKAEKHGKGKV